MPDLMNWLRRYVPASGYPAETPSGAPVEYNSWDHPWWFMVNTESGAEWLTDKIQNVTPEEMYRIQPHMRTVIDFLSRNIAQLGIHTFERVDENDRRRDHDSPIAKLMRQPNPQTTRFELIYGTVADLSLYDLAYWWVQRSTTSPSGWVIVRLPVPWVSTQNETPFGWKEYYVNFPGTSGRIKIRPDQLIVYHGYSPTSLHRGVSPVEALKDTLFEQLEAVRYRAAVWKRGGKVSSVITRPPGVKWSDAARKQFSESWKSKFTGDGPDTGGTPILEDGMTLNRVDFSAHEQQFVEGARLSLNTVASVYHVNPTMIGLLDNANYSNVREFRKMLYGDTLGPTIEQIEDRMNTFLLPMLGMDETKYYVEFNVAEKLQGNFEEQAAVLSTSVGAPWMTRNEARAKQNMPALEDGDELITPLNVLQGGQASPNDTGTQNVDPNGVDPNQVPKGAEGATSSVSDEFIAGAYIDRVKRSVTPKLKSGMENWFDFDRWDRELSQDNACSLEAAHELNAQIKKEVEECS